MRTPTLPVLLLICAVAGCTGDTPTAISTGGGATARVAANAAVLPFHGTVDSASHIAVYDFGTNTAFIHLVGTGTATQVGRYTLVVDYALSLLTTAGPERMTLTAANGDVLTAEGTARGTPSEDGQSLSSLESLTITGGTGRFVGATGSFVLRQVNLAADRNSSGSFEGTISLGR
jgi:hypothetical protein